MSYEVRFGICVAVGFVGLSMVMAQQSIALLIIGFLLVAVAVALGHYYWARMHQTKNHMDAEIAALSKMGEQNLKEQERLEKGK